MALSLRNKNSIYLVGSIDFNIVGSKLPSNRQVLSVFFYNVRVVKLKTRESASLVIREVMIFWEKARIPIKQNQHCISKVLKIYDEWRYLQKNNKKDGNVFRERENAFKSNLDNLFDVAHADALSMLKIEEDRQFLISQRQPGRVGCMGGVDYIYSEVEKKREKRKQEELNREQYHLASKIPRNFTENVHEDDSDIEVEEINDCTSTSPYQQSSTIKRATKHFITPKLVAVLDRCRVSARNSIFILQAAAEALGHNLENLIITKTSIHQQREKIRCERAQNIKAKFKESVQPFLVVHWDGKLLPALSKCNCYFYLQMQIYIFL